METQAPASISLSRWRLEMQNQDRAKRVKIVHLKELLSAANNTGKKARMEIAIVSRHFPFERRRGAMHSVLRPPFA